MTGDRQDDAQHKQQGQKQFGQDRAADKPDRQQGGTIDDRISKAQEDAAKQRAEEGGYQ